MNDIATRYALTARQRHTFAHQLDEQYRFRVEQIATLEVTGRFRTRADSSVDREIDEAILRAARDALADIESARARLATNRYGYCIDCGEPMPVERLEVLPYVARCMSCHRRSSP